MLAIRRIAIAIAIAIAIVVVVVVVIVGIDVNVICIVVIRVNVIVVPLVTLRSRSLRPNCAMMVRTIGHLTCCLLHTQCLLGGSLQTHVLCCSVFRVAMHQTLQEHAKQAVGVCDIGVGGVVAVAIRLPCLVQCRDHSGLLVWSECFNVLLGEGQ
jgi:hypothetical protein